jgi:hypothetical protein
MTEVKTKSEVYNQTLESFDHRIDFDENCPHKLVTEYDE